MKANAENTTSASATKSQEIKEEYNIFRDSTLRYMGYANEIGESFRYQAPRLVAPTYVLAFGYCAADSFSAGYRKWNEDATAKLPATDAEVSQQTKATFAALDTLLWQTFASVLIPGGTINIIVRASRFAMSRSAFATIPMSVKSWAPTFSGLGSIPFIVHPIDGFVDKVLDNTTRKWFKEYDRK